MRVRFFTFSDVKDFIGISQNCIGEVTLKSLDGKYSVNGKSILGVYSLDLSKSLLIDASEEDLEKFKKFLVY